MGTVRVKVKYFSFFQNITGKDEEYINLEKPDMKGLIELLEKKYQSQVGDTTFGLRPARNRREFMISVNGKLADWECLLKDNDEVSLLPPWVEDDWRQDLTSRGKTSNFSREGKQRLN